MSTPHKAKRIEPWDMLFRWNDDDKQKTHPKTGMWKNFQKKKRKQSPKMPNREAVGVGQVQDTRRASPHFRAEDNFTDLIESSEKFSSRKACEEIA